MIISELAIRFLRIDIFKGDFVIFVSKGKKMGYIC